MSKIKSIIGTTSPTGWRVFSDASEYEIAAAQAHASGDVEELDRIVNRSVLEWVGFCRSLEIRVPGPVFRVNVVGEDSDESFQTMLVGDDLCYLFAEVRKLLLSGIVGHICITCISLESNVEPSRRAKT